MDDIRLADLKEWYAGTGTTDIPEHLSYVYDSAAYGKVAIGKDNEVLLAFGVDPWEPEVGNIWMFATDTAERLAVSLHKEALKYLEEMQSLFPTLRALSDSRNTKHHRWLEWLGFSFIREESSGPFGLPFKLYTRRQ
ncbi:hypothetical protein HGG76_02530 [Ochrobactrum tritici]|nr:hypothetical protein [Brucella tritici]